MCAGEWEYATRPQCEPEAGEGIGGASVLLVRDSEQLHVKEIEKQQRS